MDYRKLHYTGDTREILVLGRLAADPKIQCRQERDDIHGAGQKGNIDVREPRLWVIRSKGVS